MLCGIKQRDPARSYIIFNLSIVTSNTAIEASDTCISDCARGYIVPIEGELVDGEICSLATDDDDEEGEIQTRLLSLSLM